MIMRLLKQALCLWIVFAIALSGTDFFMSMAKMLPAASEVISWAGGMASSVIGVFAGKAAWDGFELGK